MATRWMKWDPTTHLFYYSTDGVNFNTLPLNASCLTEGTVDPARLPAGGGGIDTSGDHTWTGTNEYSGAAPKIRFNETDQGANLKNWEIMGEGAALQFRTLDDAYGTPATLFQIGRSGFATLSATGAGSFNLNANFNGQNAIVFGNQNAGSSAWNGLVLANNLNAARGYVAMMSSAFTAGTFQPDSLNIYSGNDIDLNAIGDLTLRTGNTSRLSISAAGTITFAGAINIGSNTLTCGAITCSSINASSHIKQALLTYVYPGCASGGTAYQATWYLASHATYGLFTNTGLYVTSTITTPAGVSCATVTATGKIDSATNVEASYFGVTGVQSVTLTSANQSVALSANVGVLKATFSGGNIGSITGGTAGQMLIVVFMTGGTFGGGGNTGPASGTIAAGMSVWMYLDSTTWRRVGG